MAKLQTSPISAQDLSDFATNDSDFGFEMNVLSRLRQERFSCLHSGTYRDPVTNKVRQFDIRAYRADGDCKLAMAVECKNIRPNSPLLISAVPRTTEEAFHDLIVCRTGAFVRFEILCQAQFSIYRTGGMVGKKTDQVGRDTSGDLVSNDEATFDKLNQAVNSCRDLISEQTTIVETPTRRAIVPVLVVPSGLLWQINYDQFGAVTAPPHQVKNASLYLDTAWSAKSPYGDELTYRLSHIEILTFDALVGLWYSWLGPDGFFQQ